MTWVKRQLIANMVFSLKIKNYLKSDHKKNKTFEILPTKVTKFQ